jgi:hypothetical protein
VFIRSKNPYTIVKKKFLKTRKILEHVLLSFNKGRHLTVCICYGNDNVRMKSISYGIHENVLRMYDVSASKIARKFQEYVDHNVVY